MKLTDKVIQNAKPKDKEFALHDGAGLYLRVKLNGSKLWRWEYWVLKNRRSLPLGAYPDVPLKKAREMVVSARYLVSQGADPKIQIKEKQQAILESPGSRSYGDTSEGIQIDQVTAHSPFRSLALAWFNHWKLGKAPGHSMRTRNRLTDNLFPVLGALPINEIEAPDLVEMAQSVEKRRGGGTDLAQRSIQTAGQIMRYGINHGRLKRNPAADIKPIEILRPVETKNQARVEEAELPALLVAMDEYKGRLIVKYAAQVMVLVFLRTAEMINGLWPEVDFRERIWRVPAERMKMKKLHFVPLARQTIELLEKIKKLSNESNLMFPGEFSKSGRIHGNSLLEMLETIGYKEVQTGHGFRGIASTILHERGFDEAHIEMQLAHSKKSKVKAAYDHSRYLEKRREMMQAWADYVDDALQRGYEARQEKVLAQVAD
jgi:integrase